LLASSLNVDFDSVLVIELKVEDTDDTMFSSVLV